MVLSNDIWCLDHVSEDTAAWCSTIANLRDLFRLFIKVQINFSASPRPIYLPVWQTNHTLVQEQLTYGAWWSWLCASSLKWLFVRTQIGLIGSDYHSSALSSFRLSFMKTRTRCQPLSMDRFPCPASHRMSANIMLSVVPFYNSGKNRFGLSIKLEPDCVGFLPLAFQTLCYLCSHPLLPLH